jgi:hypothetical protein
VFGQEIWVGEPGAALAIGAAHVAWQAGHEATVKEVGEVAHGKLAERQVEQVAVVLLAERAAEAGRKGDHAQWLSHLGDPGPSTRRADLDPDALEVLTVCRRAL